MNEANTPPDPNAPPPPPDPNAPPPPPPPQTAPSPARAPRPRDPNGKW